MSHFASTTSHDVPSEADIVQKVLPNGITVLVRENFTAKSVVITGSVAAGAILEPQAGLVSFLCGTLMRGTQQRDFTTLHETLETVGASLNVNGGRHSVSFGGKSLGEDLPLMLELLADVLRYPAFPVEQVTRLRGELLTYLKIRQQDTRYMAGRTFSQLAYPASHPYHHDLSGTVESISALTIEDLQAFHAQQFGPQGMIIVIVGNVQAEEAIAQVATYLGDWQNPTQQAMPPLPALEPLRQITSETIEIDGKSQVDIVLGVAGPKRTAPDYQAARLANNVFGVFGMYGRLGKNVREAQGLAYYSYSQMAGGVGPGAWRVAAGVDPMNAQRAIDSIRVEIERMYGEPISADDLADNLANLTGSLPLQLESNEGVAGSIYNMAYYGLGLNYLRDYADMLNAITITDIQAAFQHYWKPDAFAVAVAGSQVPTLSF